MVKSQAHKAHNAFIKRQEASAFDNWEFIDSTEWGAITQQWLKKNYPETTVEEHSKRPWAGDNADDSVTVYRFQDGSFIAFNRNQFFDIN